MYDWLTFTYDENNTYNSYSDLPAFIRELKARGIHFIQSVVCSEITCEEHTDTLTNTKNAYRAVECSDIF